VEVRIIEPGDHEPAGGVDHLARPADVRPGPDAVDTSIADPDGGGARDAEHAGVDDGEHGGHGSILPGRPATRPVLHDRDSAIHDPVVAR
jgi:hypothetical protein